MAKNVLMDDEDYQEFKGITLQLKTENNKQEILDYGEGSDTDSIAKLSIVNSPVKDGNFGYDNGNEKPAVLSGSDVISPILSIPKRVTACLFNAANTNENGNAQQCTDILVAKPYENLNPKDFFSFRTGLVENAIKECKNSLLTDQDGDFIDAWLLTEISLWDNEKERLVILTEKYVFIVKYDFIALKHLEHRKVELSKIDTIIVGDLVYPPNSLIPRLNGIANGMTSVVRGCVLERPRTDSTIPGIDLTYFEPKDRGMLGIRLLWNSGQPLPFIKRWNPFTDDLPLLTFTSHPLYWHKDLGEGLNQRMYDCSDFENKVGDGIELAYLSKQQTLPRNYTSADINQKNCKIIHKSILLDNYVGFGAVIHNKNSLGFFKVRGKFSF